VVLVEIGKHNYERHSFFFKVIMMIKTQPDKHTKHCILNLLFKRSNEENIGILQSNLKKPFDSKRHMVSTNNQTPIICGRRLDSNAAPYKVAVILSAGDLKGFGSRTTGTRVCVANSQISH
jgi:hypothetical protein